MNIDTIKPCITKIRRAANIGLYGSIGVVLTTLAFYYLSKYHVSYQTENVQRMLLIGGSLLSVAAVMSLLMMLRKRTPKLRQLESIEDRFKLYTQQTHSIYYSSLVIVIIECALMLVMNDNSLLMITMIIVLLMFLSYPNIYKMKNDLGLLDSEMSEIFGDQYIGDSNQENE